MLLSSISLALTRLGQRLARWSPLALWPDGIATPGMWISPRTLTSEWQDYTGTTPVVTPGTVADSSNPVGLALDIRAGALTTRGPELVVNGGCDTDTAWSKSAGVTISGGTANWTAASSAPLYQGVGTVGSFVEITFTVISCSSGGFSAMGNGTVGPVRSTPGTYSDRVMVIGGPNVGIFSAASTTGSIDNISVREIPGNHMLQSTSAARPLESAYDGQTLGPGNTYDATGYPVFQLYDGIDDSMATASFAAGTLLINGMDCMIAVRRDSAANVVLMYSGSDPFLGCAQSGSSSGCTSSSGAPTVWLDGVQLAGGTAVTRDTLHAALTPGAFHILEFRGADLSHWTSVGFGAYTAYLFNGARGDIMLFESTASTEDKDKARQYLADKYGVTLA